MRLQNSVHVAQTLTVGDPRSVPAAGDARPRHGVQAAGGDGGAFAQ